MSRPPRRPIAGRTAATRLTPPDGDSPPSTTMSTPGWLRTATASSRRSPGARPSTRCTTMPSTAAAASSAAWPVASLARSTLISSLSARISSSLRWTPPTTSSVGGAEQLGGVGDHPLVALQQGDAGFAGDRLDAAQVGADRALADDLDRADVAVARTCVPPHSSIDGPASRTRTMSPYLSPKNAIAPISSASALRRLERPHAGVGERLRVGHPLDLGRSARRHRLVVGEVEAQAVGGDERAGLLDVVAEHLAQGAVQQVGGGVVAPRRVAPLDVDGRRGDLARRDRAVDDAADVAAQVGQGERRVERPPPSPVSVVIVPRSPIWPPLSA